MKKMMLIASMSILTFLVITGCKKKKTEPEPESERIRKVWIVEVATENATTVYTRSATRNTRNYGSFMLDLGNAPEVVLREVDGSTFKGQYSIDSNGQLFLTGLTPQPSGTGGQIAYSFQFVGEKLQLTQLKPSIKTGNSMNVYLLINQ